ncbi:MAG: FAD-binding oxidoreductase [Paracoccaceae bacterium]|nr:FAD-binding oxidoreductase [Paracoccaceae bacterium]
MNIQSGTFDATASADALDALRSGLRGDALLPGTDSYDTARAVWNAMIDRHPGLIVRPRGVADVIDAVNFARDHDLPVSIKGGGHNVAGHAVCDGGLMIDLGLMRTVRVDPQAQRAQVEGGATWGDVDRESQAFGLATPGGLISDTGVAGLTLAGGIGWLRSRWGLCVDNVISFDVVTAAGELVTASADRNPDLYWALRGGGGNFGVVVNFEFALHPLGPTVMFAAPIYPLNAGPGPIRFWRDFLADWGDRIGSLVEFSTVAESEDFPEAYWGQRCYTIAAVWAGDADEGERVMQPLREQGDLITDFSSQMAYCDVQRLFDTLMPAGDFRCYWKSHYLAGLPDEMIEAALTNAAATPSDNTLSSLWNMGAATMAVPAEATAIGDRSMGWMYSLDSVWPDPADDEANIAFTRKAWEETRNFSQEGRLYLNFAGHGEDGEALVKDAYGKNYAKLAAIKAKYDPENLFRFNQNIRPAN